MSNKDRAVKVIYDTLSGQYGDFRTPTGAGEALAEAGLLAADLPEPDGQGRWFAGADGIEVHDGMVFHAHGLTGRDLDPGVARSLAYVLLAAANHAEKENQK